MCEHQDVYTYVYTYICVHTYIYIYTYVYIYTYMHAVNLLQISDAASAFPWPVCTEAEQRVQARHGLSKQDSEATFTPVASDRRWVYSSGLIPGRCRVDDIRQATRTKSLQASLQTCPRRLGLGCKPGQSLCRLQDISLDSHLSVRQYSLCNPVSRINVRGSYRFCGFGRT